MTIIDGIYYGDRGEIWRLPDWRVALSQAAFAVADAHAVREAGFTEAALQFPRSHRELVAICAFNGLADPSSAPRGWHYFPNAATAKAWRRVIAALDAVRA